MGAWYIKWAWVARSGASIDKVTRSGFELFQQYLARGQGVLQRARALNPRQITTVALLLTVLRGRQAPEHVLVQLWEQGQQSCDGPLLVKLWNTRLQSVASKWGGSHEQMFALARHAVKIAPPGHPLIGLIIEAHAEIPLYYDMESDELKLSKSEVNHLRAVYFHKPEVRNEILAAYEKWSQKDSVQYDEMEVQVARSLFALALWWIWRLPKELGGQNSEHLKVVRQLVRSIWLKPEQLSYCYCWIPNVASRPAAFKQLCHEVGC
uniref:Uncharacterized protein n=1 Tax=Paramoeba aestuarina TaxID=180227 RepID=A0A7S4K0F4_9EUKA|mmetsp:Transcript_14504/g.22647  ORF Transcript_14504/g.22647 Transcript_14504/m.22647 type:complete len:265 (+) Transcript_14504:506-1300(+)